jgi:hypothetical protein
VAETGPIWTASATTQSWTNPVSCGLWESPRFSATFARAGVALPVSAACSGGLRRKNAARSLARANPFPADFIPAGRDSFACRLRPVRIHSRRPSECKHRRATARSPTATFATRMGRRTAAAEGPASMVLISPQSTGTGWNCSSKPVVYEPSSVS